jgi:3-deoxy-D-manno-octulosonic-acid transferase
VCGDTRFDRVAAIAQQTKPFPEIEQFIGGRNCIIAGSTWPPDEQLLAKFMPRLPEAYCLIIAPHDISASHIAQIKTMFPERQCYTDLDAEKRSKILIVNTIGILNQLYQYARFVYIGGGFGVNIHNIQEPVTFGCPVVFGPKYKSFKEAVDLVELGGAFHIDSRDDLNSIFDRLINDESFRQEASRICREYVASQSGATDAIMHQITSIFSV